MTGNLNYFTATILKDGKITVPKEQREYFEIAEGDKCVFQYVRKLTVKSKEAEE
jgi:AbrB family looped-hinge helix DNA binding protein